MTIRRKVLMKLKPPRIKPLLKKRKIKQHLMHVSHKQNPIIKILRLFVLLLKQLIKPLKQQRPLLKLLTLKPLANSQLSTRNLRRKRKKLMPKRFSKREPNSSTWSSKTPQMLPTRQHYLLIW